LSLHPTRNAFLHALSRKKHFEGAFEAVTAEAVAAPPQAGTACGGSSFGNRHRYRQGFRPINFLAR
jgi:hypothetical protein